MSDYSRIYLYEEPLTAGQIEFTSWIAVRGADSIVISPYADTDFKYSVQYSVNKIDVDSDLSSNYRVGAVNPPNRFTNTRAFVRLRFENTSTSDQTMFRVNVIVGDAQLLNSPLDSRLAQTFDALAVRTDNFFHDVANNRRGGQRILRKFGYNPSLSSGSPETLWEHSSLFQPMTVAGTLDITSDDSEDSIAGSGARTLELYGIDENREEQRETIIPIGTGTITTTKLWLGLNRVRVSSAGNSMVNEGDITITATTGGAMQATIPAGKSTTQQMFYFCPVGRVAQFDDLVVSCLKLSGGGTPRVNITANLWDFNNNVVTEVYSDDLDTSVANRLTLSPKEPFTVIGGMLLEFRATTTVNNTIVRGQVFGIEYEDAPANSTLDI